MKLNKYNNIKITIDNLKFDSKREAARFSVLKLLERGNLISDLKLQVKFELAPSVVVAGRKKPALKYICDFTYVENGKLVIEDVKGRLTDIYVLKRHLMKSVYGIDIKET
jgi:hypothetical protein